MKTKPELEFVEVILRGNFNPLMFTPAWFCSRGLLPSVAEGVDTLQATPGDCGFNFEWLHFRANPEYFQLWTTSAPYVRLRDLASSVFRDHLPSIPLIEFGINRCVHFVVQDSSLRDVIMQTLAPLEAWAGWSERSDAGTFAMAGLGMSQSHLRDRPEGDRINVIIEPSLQVGGRDRGVFVRVNDYYLNSDPQNDASSLIKTLEENFDSSLLRSADLIDYVSSMQGARESR